MKYAGIIAILLAIIVLIIGIITPISMRYDDFVKWCEQNDIYPDWCAIPTYVQGGIRKICH